jgi:hypothetical protein
MRENMRENNKWYQTLWLPFAAGTYIVICIFDFMIMPIYVTAHNSRIENAVLKSLDSKDAATFADGLIKANQAQRQWNPLTLLGAGMFHLSFGALLTGGAVTRGFAKKSEIEGYYRNHHDDYYHYESDRHYNNSYNRSKRPHDYTNHRPRYRHDEPDGPMPKADMDDKHG